MTTWTKLSFTDPVIVLFVYVVIHWPCYCTICSCCHSLTLLLYYLFMLSFTDPVIVLFVYVVIHWSCYCTICSCCHSLTLLLYYLFMWSFTDPVIVLFVHVVIHWPCYCTIFINMDITITGSMNDNINK
jgi:divalent metal cation (Fe/Co/Zn/Cd) transporter